MQHPLCALLQLFFAKIKVLNKVNIHLRAMLDYVDFLKILSEIIETMLYYELRWLNIMVFLIT